MKNKTLIYTVVLSVIILGAGIWIYFAWGNKTADNNAGRETDADIESITEDEKSTSGENEFSDNEDGEKYKEERRENIWVDDNFSIIFPQNWEARPAPMGISAIAVNANEEITNPEAKKINFQSYIAVTYDTLQGRSQEEYIQYTKDSLKELSLTAMFDEGKQILIDGKNAQAIEIGINQKGIDFKTLVILVWAGEEDVWYLSCNTTKDKWVEYEPLFYEAANNFRIK